ncbi:MAG: hypothetical protein RMJ43_13050 [Chloroherpetonaceae bacterium]|nr:hypothetical protein [Chthonomonadaceae bacterium]MDW8208754.1 hypothetical protein [Chloroherpetonaceae bacterium]
MLPGILARAVAISGTRASTLMVATGIFLVGLLLPLRGQPARTSTRTANVAILVTPTSAHSARVALAYAGKVPHSRVRKQVLRLVTLTGGKLTSGIRLEDASLDPGNSRRFPVMTAAEFSMDLGRQFQEDEPVVLPYLKAFREWRRIDLLWHLPGAGSEPVRRFESPVMSVWRFRDAQMLYYHADIHDNAAELPAPDFAVAHAGHPDRTHIVDAGSAPGGTRSPGDTGSLLPVLLIGTGAVLSGGAILYLLAVRWSARVKAAHTRAHSRPAVRRD